ncbi:Cdt1, partial [Symbiodinium sp. KB8]
GVAAGAPALPRALLPLALGMLVRFSAGLDTVMHMQWRRRGRSALLTFDMLKPSVQAVVRHTFSQGHLEELAGVAPDLYRLSTKCMNASGQPVVGAQALDKRTWRVVVEWPGGEAPSQTTLTHRRRAFAKAAWDVARTAHRAFLRTVAGSVPPAVATHRAWHPHFKVDAVPIPRAPVAPPPAARPAGARDLLAAATTTPTLTRALQAAAGLPLSPPRSHKRTASAARLAHHPGSPAKAPRAAADMTTPVRVAGNSGVLLAGVAGGGEARKGGGGGLDTGTTLGTHTTTTSVARALAGSLCEGEAALLRAGRRVHTGTARPASARERASRLLVQRPHQHHPSDATTEAGSVASATGASLPPELAFLARAAPQLLARSQRRTEAAAGASTAQAKAASRAAALSRELPPLLDAVAMQFIQAKRSVLPLAELVEKLGAAARNSGAPRAAAEIRGNLRALAAHSNGWASIVQVTSGEFFRIQRSADAHTMKDVRHRISHIDASALLER